MALQKQSRLVSKQHKKTQTKQTNKEGKKPPKKQQHKKPRTAPPGKTQCVTYPSVLVATSSWLSPLVLLNIAKPCLALPVIISAGFSLRMCLYVGRVSALVFRFCVRQAIRIIRTVLEKYGTYESFEVATGGRLLSKCQIWSVIRKYMQKEGCVGEVIRVPVLSLVKYSCKIFIF